MASEAVSLEKFYNLNGMLGHSKYHYIIIVVHK